MFTSGNISIENFIYRSNLSSIVVLEQEVSDVSILYATDCNVFNECHTQIKGVLEALDQINKTIWVDQKVHLDITFTFKLSSLFGANVSTNDVKQPATVHEVQIVLYNSDQIKCEYLADIGRIKNFQHIMSPEFWKAYFSLSYQPKIGFGYNEALLHCKKLKLPIQKADFLVMFIQFGNSNMVPESYDIFRKRMDFVNSQHDVFLQKIIQENPSRLPEPWKSPSSIIYCPIPLEAVNKEYQNLLQRYAEKWTKFGKTKNVVGFVVEVTSTPNNKIGEKGGFSLIPYVDSSVCNYDSNMKWYAPVALDFLNQYFNSVVLTDAEWKMLNSEESTDFSKKLNMVNSNVTGLNVILDYSDAFLYDKTDIPGFNHCEYNWLEVESNLQKFAGLEHSGASKLTTYGYHDKMEVSALIFAVGYNTESNKYSLYVDVSSAKRMSSNYAVGCAYRPMKYGSTSIINTDIDAVVAACNHINSSFYVIQTPLIDLDTTELDPKTSYLYYENVIRKQLNEINLLRSKFLKRHPDATVYIQPTINPAMNMDYVTVFCNSEALSVNEYVDAIVRWAKLNEIPLIFKPAFQYGNGGQGWFSYLIPQVTTDYGMEFADLYSLFVLRNYPQGINGWNVDTCIEEITGEPSNVEKTYFHNDVVGVMVDTRFMRNGTRIKKKEFEVMLEYPIHRFNLIEVIVDLKECGNIMGALKKLAEIRIIDSSKQILLQLVPKSGKHGPLTSFLECGKDILTEQKVLSFIGMHSKLHLSQEKIVVYHDDLLDARDRYSNLNLGVLFSSSTCMEIISFLIFRNSSNNPVLKLIGDLNYIICEEELILFVDDIVESLGEIFDTHLYIQRLIAIFKPPLKLYFRIYVNVLHGLTNGTMSRYLNLLSNFKNFGTAYNISYLLVEGYDSELGNKQGWWQVTNYADLSDPNVYLEKESVYFGTEMWRPKRAPIPSKDSSSTVEYVIAAAVISALLITCLILGSCLYTRLKNFRTRLTDEQVKEFLEGNFQMVGVDDNAIENEFVRATKFDESFELSILDLSIGETLNKSVNDSLIENL
ncbi:unnamed protein product [Orchesella dallaii]|uniref:Uncharacterized protein n=1 Tax=Orchesella dallaii TaxID=48710 RepID=A0ABP1RPG4_9HEXA